MNIEPSRQGRPADYPAAWADAVTSLVSLSEAMAVADSYTDGYLAKFITADAEMLRIKAAVKAISRLTTIHTILITGPSGHGKELLARALHWRPSEPFIAVNCAALPESLLSSTLFGHVQGSFTGATEDRPGVFEAAGQGTVFLDEIGDMPENQQCALLRVIQEREFTRVGDPKNIIKLSSRIVAATNRPETLRDDLFGRLMAVHLEITPLISRPDDVRLIASHLNLPADFTADPTQLARYGVRYLQAMAVRKLIGL